MKTASELSALGQAGSPIALAIGVFDGVHRGHQKVIEVCRERAAEFQGLAAVLTFHPHPAKVVRPETAPLLLTTEEQDLELFAALGVDLCVSLEFDSVLRGTNAHAFLTELRSVCPNLRAVIVGHQWHFGCDRDGNFSVLSRFAAERGFEAVEVPPVRHEGEIISSTRIRALVGEGRMEEAARLLGRPYSIRARVVPGSGIGRMLGFPTANLQVENELLPAPGVYACRVRSEGESHAAALNCGHRPTLPGQATASLTVEAHLIDFRGDLKDARVEVDFGTRLRDERKFAGAEELRAQIARDVAGVRASWSAFQGR